MYVYFLEFVNDVNVHSKSKSAKRRKKKQTWKPTSKVFTDVGYRWKPIGRTFTIVGNLCPLTRITSTKVEPLKKTTLKSVTTTNPEIKIYRRKTKVAKSVVQIVLWYLDSGCSKHMTKNRSQLVNFVHKFLGTVRFGNDQIAKIMGYGDYQMGNVTISRVYYVEGLGHNLFSIGQFCNSELEVAFRKHTCYIRDLEGVDLLKRSRGSNLYTLSLEDMMLSLPISRALGKSKKHIHKPKAEDTVQEKLYLLHMDLCGPMRIQSINGQKYTLVIVDDYSRKPDLSYRYVFGALCYPTNDSKDLGKLKPKADIGIFVGYAPHFNPPPGVALPVPTVVAPDPADSTSLPSLTSVDQDAPSPSTSQTPQETQPLVIPSSVQEEFQDIEVAHLDNEPFFGVLVP
ncbi:retrovirus-related pol polyprotein from transposon TNT 1-94 [Tanacetum coccineum]